MPIAGFELPQHVYAQLSALRRERLNSLNEMHLAEIDKQIELFEAEAKRIQAEEKERAKREYERLLGAAESAARR